MTQDEIIELWVQSNQDIYVFSKLVDAKATAREREECAKVCESQEDEGGEWDIKQQCANAIRARGNT